MIKCYKLPIKGTYKNRAPLTGDTNDPICVVPIAELPNCPEEPFSYVCLGYDLDKAECEIELRASEDFHTWLTELTTTDKTQLANTVKAKKWVVKEAIAIQD